MNREGFTNGEYYHVYNRGVDKREIFSGSHDIQRFLKGMEFFNSVEPIGSLYALSFEEPKKKKSKKLVDIIAYCLNGNHYHFILRQKVGRGITEFMRRVNGGYTMYFNIKYERTGALFQGAFKSKHIFDNDYLLHLSAYVNLNYKVHQLRGETSKLVRSSWGEYTEGVHNICSAKIIMDQFKNSADYKKFALEALPVMLQRKEDEKEIKRMLME